MNTASLVLMQSNAECDLHSTDVRRPAAPGWIWHCAWWLPLFLAVPWLTFAPGSESPQPLQGLSGLILVLSLSVAVVTDLRGRRIRNWTTYPAVGYAFLCNGCQSLAASLQWTTLAETFGGIGIVESLLGAVLCFSAMFTLFLLFGGGAGDVKLMIVLGALCGWKDGFQIWFCTMLIGAVYAVIHVAWQVGPRALCGYFASWMGVWGLALAARWNCLDHHRAETAFRFRIPLAPFFATGTAIVLGMPWFMPGASLLSVLFG